MTTGYVLIGAILILGGLIATVGDRIGTRVGKARLSLFNLRPRNTAVLVTIITGSVISASTLTVLFAASDQLRTGVFELGKIQKNLSKARKEIEDIKTQKKQLETEKRQLEEDLEKTQAQKSRVEGQLSQARIERKAEQAATQKQQAEAQARLTQINQSLQASVTKQAQTQDQLNQTQTQLQQTQDKQAQTQSQLNLSQSELSQASNQYERAQAQLNAVSKQVRILRTEIQQRQAERQELVNEIDQRETRLKELQAKQQYLEQQVATLEQYYQSYQVLRLGNVVLFRGQVLATDVVRLTNPAVARSKIEQLLWEANQRAIEITKPGTNPPANQQVIQIEPGQIAGLIAKIDDGRAYIVRIFSAGNYVLGEKQLIQVVVDADLNQIVFGAGDVVATISADPTTMTAEQIQQQINQLLRASQFRARSAGILGNTIQIGDGRLETLIRFLAQIRQYNQSVDIKAIAADTIYTAGPLKVELVAVQNGQVIFQTQSINSQVRGTTEPQPLIVTPSSPANSTSVDSQP